MIKNLSEKQLTEWIDNYVDNSDLPFVTNSVMIERNDLEKLVNGLDKRADGVRIYFIRFKENDPNYHHTTPPPNKHMNFAGKRLTQVSIAIVPTINYKLNPDTNIGSSDDLKGQDNKFTVFVPGGENSGLCPPNCKR